MRFNNTNHDYNFLFDQPCFSSLFSTSSPIFIMFLAKTLRLLHCFGDYRYFRQIANFMKIKAPLVNQEIDIRKQTVCIVHGLKKIQIDPVFGIASAQDIQHSEKVSVQNEQHQKEGAEQLTPKRDEPQYIFEQHSQIKLPFDQALSVASALQLDLCLIKPESDKLEPVLSISSVCKGIYSSYYQNHIKKKGKHDFKTIKFSDRINQNDIMTKYNNLKRMHEEGQRKFRLESNNDSSKSEKLLIDFAKLFDKKVEPYLKSFKASRRFQEQKWVCTINFDEDIPIDSEKVNKRWRRYKFQQEKAKINVQEENIEDFQGGSVEMQRQLYQVYKELKIKMPPKYQELADIESNLVHDKYALYRAAAEQSPEQTQFEWDEEEQKRFEQKQARFNRQFFGERTVEEIISEMQELKRSGYESEGYKVARFRQLKAQLELYMNKKNIDL